MNYSYFPATLLALAATVVGGVAQNTTIFDRVGNANHIVWYGANLRPYQVEVSPDLVSWGEIGPVYVGADDLLGYTDNNNALSLFYRVREGAMRPGFDDVEFGRNDDKTYPDCDEVWAMPQTVPIGFPINFFGTTYTDCYINNNGNITFDAPLSDYTPSNLGEQERLMIAPFWADVDTRLSTEGPPYSNLTRFSATPEIANGRPAFGVTWPGVGYYGNGGAHVDKLNHFQMLLIDRSDIQSGDFDREFNYNQVQWETGDASGGSSGLGGSPARVGWANGSGRFMEYKGSGQTLAFLDSQPGQATPNYTDGLKYQMWNSSVPGRIVIPVRRGIPVSEPGYEFQADAGVDQTLAFGAGRSVTLTGAINPSGVSGVAHAWTQVEPTYPLAEISNPESLVTSVVLPEPREYKFRLTATKQGTFFSSSSDEVIITHPDVIDVYAGFYYSFEGTLENSFELDQAVATYNDNDMTNVEWEQIDGDPCIINNPDAIIPTIVFPGPGDYAFRLTGRSGGLPQWEQSSEAFVTIDEP